MTEWLLLLGLWLTGIGTGWRLRSLVHVTLDLTRPLRGRPLVRIRLVRK